MIEVVTPAFWTMAPTTVSVPVNGAAVAVASSVSVTVEPGAAGFALNLPVTPLGLPCSTNWISPGKPNPAVMRIVVLTDDPSVSVNADGAAVNSNCGAAVTLRASEMVWVTPPQTPVMVMLPLDAEVDDDADKLSRAVPPSSTTDGVSVPVTPAGNPETLTDTLPLNPFHATVKTESLMAPGTVRVKEEAEATIVKSGTSATVAFKVAALVRA